MNMTVLDRAGVDRVGTRILFQWYVWREMKKERAKLKPERHVFMRGYNPVT